MYHLELRHFPHSAWRFNLTEQELAAILQPWVREQAVDVGERKWSPHLAKLTILEGPKLDVAELSMGRGWRSAQRQSEDVTERALDAARETLTATPALTATPTPRGVSGEAPAGVDAPPAGAPSAPAVSAGPGPAAGVDDPVALGVQLAALLGSDPMALLEAWRAAAAGSPGLPPSDSLALAERAVRRASGE
jgi:hypothetical protein